MEHIGEVFKLDSIKEAIYISHWYDAMNSKISSILENNTLQLVSHPSHKKNIGAKWIFQAKFQFDGSLDKYKDHCVAKGYAQKEGEDYDKTFALIACFTTICLVFAISSHFAWPIYQMDVKSAFLNGDLEEEVYVEQP